MEGVTATNVPLMKDSHLNIDKAMGMVNLSNEGSEEETLKQQVDEMVTKIDDLEQKVNEVAQFFSSPIRTKLNNCKGSSSLKEREKDKARTNNKKLQDASRREAAYTKRMQELMRQFGTILRQITQHKWAWPFMQPVDVERLGLHDYYEVIEKPMDFGTIRNQMEAKDGSGYKNVREIYNDVILVFKNAMTYNDEKSDVHLMAKTLFDKFEEKWQLLLPKVVEEETRRKEEEAEGSSDLQIAQEASIVKLGRDISYELEELDLQLKELRERVVLKCRLMSTEEKRQLGLDLSQLSPEDLVKALDIVAQRNPHFQPMDEEVDLDVDAQSPLTLWQLKFFVKEKLGNQMRGSATKEQDNAKRKREICDAISKSARKRNRKLMS
ncbi:transcription factor GTE6 isoform X2 [Amborella trichopoda]|nr:transcription factor GTE6 isoform X2 [Amborella trichopoda]|eukprot:XP_006878570.2 transcription factor GTE6 isoform X2 [Amborella trichopoda]